MKKAFALFVLFLLPFSFAAKECVKTDFSNQQFKNLTAQGMGLRTMFDERFTDVCTGAAQVKEYYCFNAFLRSSDEACPEGKYCAQGACGPQFAIVTSSYDDRIAKIETNYPAECFVSNSFFTNPVEIGPVFAMNPSIDGLRNSKVKAFSGDKVFFLCSLTGGFQTARATAVIPKQLPSVSQVTPDSIVIVEKDEVVSEAVKEDYGIPLTIVFLLIIALVYFWLSMPSTPKKRKK